MNSIPPPYGRGCPKSNSNKITTTMSLPEKIYLALRKSAFESNMHPGEVVAKALEQFFEKEKSKAAGPSK